MLLQVQHLYDLSLLGLKWISDTCERETPPARSISPMLYTLREAELLNKKQLTASMTDAKLRLMFCKHLVLCQETPNENRQDALIRELGQSTMHLALDLVTSQYKSSRVIDQHGYRFFLTENGRRYAQSKEEPYANIITREVFVQSWLDMRERVAKIMAIRNKRPLANEPNPADLGIEPAA